MPRCVQDLSRQRMETMDDQHKHFINLLNNLGVCHYELGEQAAARTCWDKALKLDPDSEVVRKNIDRLAN